MLFKSDMFVHCSSRSWREMLETISSLRNSLNKNLVVNYVEYIIDSGNTLSFSTSIEIPGLARTNVVHYGVFFSITKEKSIPLWLPCSALKHNCFGVFCCPSTFISSAHTQKNKRWTYISCHIHRTLCFITSDDCLARIVDEWEMFDGARTHAHTRCHDRTEQGYKGW